MSEVTLAEAKGGRARIASQLTGIQARRPGAGSGTEAQARWLQDKASVHDQIAGYLRQIGDVAGAVEAEVLASRCRIDARDLTVPAAPDGPCPQAQTRSAAVALSDGYRPGVIPAPDRHRLDQDDWVEAVTCGPGLP